MTALGKSNGEELRLPADLRVGLGTGEPRES